MSSIKNSRKSPNQRKGKIISKSSVNVASLEKMHGKVSELRQYQNGSIGAYFKNGKFRFISKNKTLSGGNLNNNKTEKPVSLKVAVKLLRKYYAEKYN